jgi:hypothetical protein
MHFQCIVVQSTGSYEYSGHEVRLGYEAGKVINESHRRKRTVYHFAPLTLFTARFRSTAPLTVYWTGAAELREI